MQTILTEGQELSMFGYGQEFPFSEGGYVLAGCLSKEEYSTAHNIKLIWMDYVEPQLEPLFGLDDAIEISDIILETFYSSVGSNLCEIDLSEYGFNNTGERLRVKALDQKSYMNYFMVDAGGLCIHHYRVNTESKTWVVEIDSFGKILKFFKEYIPMIPENYYLFSELTDPQASFGLSMYDLCAGCLPEDVLAQIRDPHKLFFRINPHTGEDFCDSIELFAVLNYATQAEIMLYGNKDDGVIKLTAATISYADKPTTVLNLKNLIDATSN